MNKALLDRADTAMSIRGFSDSRDVDKGFAPLTNKKRPCNEGKMHEARPNAPCRARENVNSYPISPDHTPSFFEERRQRIDVLEHVRREHDVHAGVGERDRPSVVLLYRVSR